LAKHHRQIWCLCREARPHWASWWMTRYSIGCARRIEQLPGPRRSAGHLRKASKTVQNLAREMMDDSMPADQRRLVPKIAWKRFIDLIRTGK